MPKNDPKINTDLIGALVAPNPEISSWYLSTEKIGIVRAAWIEDGCFCILVAGKDSGKLFQTFAQHVVLAPKSVPSLAAQIAEVREIGERWPDGIDPDETLAHRHHREDCKGCVSCQD